MSIYLCQMSTRRVPSLRALTSRVLQESSWKLVPLLVVKRGSRGALLQHGKERHTIPAPQVTFVDAVGAGDSFSAGFLHGYVNGKPLTRCLQLGNLSGALSTTAAGGTTAFRDRGAAVWNLGSSLSSHGALASLFHHRA